MKEIIITIFITIITMIIFFLFYVYRNIEEILHLGYVTNHHRNSLFLKDYYKNYISYTNEEPFRIVGIYNKKESDKIICYSLYGNNREKYYKYIKNNIRDQKKYLQDWTTRIYIHDKVNKDFMEYLIKLDAELVVINDKHIFPGNSAGAFWRFLGLIEDKDIIISDIDESLSKKIPTIKNFYSKKNKNMVYIEHYLFQPENNFLAGRIMKKKGVQIPLNPKFIMSYPVRSQYGQDEMFLAKEVYKYIKKYPIQRKRPSKLKRKIADFIIRMKYNIGDKNYLEESFENYLRKIKENL